MLNSFSPCLIKAAHTMTVVVLLISPPSAFRRCDFSKQTLETKVVALMGRRETSVKPSACVGAALR